MLYSLYATNTWYDLELLYTKKLDEAMKIGEMFGKMVENLVVWNDRYCGDPRPEKMERVELYGMGEGGQVFLGRFDTNGEFIKNTEEE